MMRGFGLKGEGRRGRGGGGGGGGGGGRTLPRRWRGPQSKGSARFVPPDARCHAGWA
ncbi:unnamed protein product [Ectocarpus sp. 8 AP-2014]